MQRRRFLEGLSALCLLPGCLPRSPALSALPEGLISAGWRWVPGAQHTWRVRVARSTARVQVQRVEEWTYRVLEVDRLGIARIQAVLTGFGAGVEVDGVPVEEAALQSARSGEQAGLLPVELLVSMSGEVLRISQQGVEAELSHRAIAQRLPARAVAVGEVWEDHSLIQHLSSAIPMEMEVRLQGQSELREVVHEEGRVAMRFATQQTASAAGGDMVIQARGDALWDAEQGSLLRRHFEVGVRPDGVGPLGEAGSLIVEVTRT